MNPPSQPHLCAADLALRIARARVMGAQAHSRGSACIPVRDDGIVMVLARSDFIQGRQILRAWREGWQEAHSAAGQAPIPTRHGCPGLT